MKHSLRVRTLIFVSSLTLSSSALAASITFNSALPVAKGTFVNRELTKVIRANDDSTTLNREISVNALVSVLGYGITGDLSLFGMLPYLDKTLDLTMNGMPVERNNRSFGNVSTFARYTFAHFDSPGRTLRFAGFAGVEAPTASDHRSDNLGRLPLPLQAGSGAWNSFGGFITTLQTLNYELDTQITYRNNGQANGIDVGNEWRVDSSLQYRIWPSDLASPVLPGFLYGVLEANLIHTTANQVDGQQDSNSGGTTLFLDPGVQFVTRRWVIETAIQLPVNQNLRGNALKQSYILNTGFRWNF